MSNEQPNMPYENDRRAISDKDLVERGEKVDLSQRL